MAGRRSRAVGCAGEDRALTFLGKRGLRCVERNFRSRFGEIDLIMLDKDVLVFVEVRRRSRSAFADAAQTVDLKKQKKLWSTALFYLSRHPSAAERACRFDVVAIDAQKLEWYRDAFRCD